MQLLVLPKWLKRQRSLGPRLLTWPNARQLECIFKCNFFPDYYFQGHSQQKSILSLILKRTAQDQNSVVVDAQRGTQSSLPVLKPGALFVLLLLFLIHCTTMTGKSHDLVSICSHSKKMQHNHKCHRCCMHTWVQLFSVHPSVHQLQKCMGGRLSYIRHKDSSKKPVWKDTVMWSQTQRTQSSHWNTENQPLR